MEPDKINCKICGISMKIVSWKHLRYKHNMTIEEYDSIYGAEKHSMTTVSAEKTAKFLATKKQNHKPPWNKGLTKNTCETINKMAEARKGDQNPVHKIKDKEAWRKNVTNGLAPIHALRKGKTLEEVHGAEKSQLIKQRQSDAAKKRLIHGHTGYTHSEGTKNKLREITSKRISTQKGFVSSPHNTLYNHLKLHFPQVCWTLEYNVGFYSIDIADINKKIAIEVDGDFWHVNPNKGYILKYESQRRNKRTEKSKTVYLLNRNWKILRFWESEIEDDLEAVLKRIENQLNEWN